MKNHTPPRALAAVLVVATMFLGFGSPTEAQENEAQLPPLVTILTASATPHKEGWKVSFSGEYSRELPKKAVLKWSLQWRMQSLREFTTTRTGTKKSFSESIEFEDLHGYAKEVFLRLEIDYFAQPREVQEKMDKDSERFLMEQNPWTIRFWDQRFDLGSDAQRSAQEQDVRKLFLETLKEGLALEKKFSSNKKAAADRSRFQSGGSFDSKSWQAFAEEEIRDPLRALQKKLREANGHLMLLTESRDYKYLNEIVNAIALRSYERSRSLYEDLGIEPFQGDYSPKDIDVNCSSSKGSYLQKRTQQLCRSQEIEMSEIR